MQSLIRRVILASTILVYGTLSAGQACGQALAITIDTPGHLSQQPQGALFGVGGYYRTTSSNSPDNILVQMFRIQNGQRVFPPVSSANPPCGPTNGVNVRWSAQLQAPNRL